MRQCQTARKIVWVLDFGLGDAEASRARLRSAILIVCRTVFSRNSCLSTEFFIVIVDWYFIGLGCNGTCCCIIS